MPSSNERVAGKIFFFGPGGQDFGRFRREKYQLGDRCTLSRSYVAMRDNAWLCVRTPGHA